MVDAVLLAYFFCVVQRDGAVAVCDDEDVSFREDLLRGHERGADDVGGFVLLVVSMVSVGNKSTADQGERKRF